MSNNDWFTQAEAMELVRRLVAHMEYEAKQGDGIMDHAWNDYQAAKRWLGQPHDIDGANAGVASVRAQLASTGALAASVTFAAKGPTLHKCRSCDKLISSSSITCSDHPTLTWDSQPV